MEIFIPRTKTHHYIITAYNRGYRITDDGKFIGLKGQRSIGLAGKQQYPTFSYSDKGKVRTMPIHQFAAYCFYKEQIFQKGIVVRHLDANTLNFAKSNIVLGTFSDNELDKPKEARIRAASIARKSQGTRPLNAKLSDKDASEIREVYKVLNGKKAPNGFREKLSVKYGTNVNTISKIASGEYYK